MNKEQKHHTKEWFLNRIGKRVYRNKQERYCCSTCHNNYENGLIVRDKQHADYLEMCQGMGLFYRDKK